MFNKPPYAERHVRWCERSENEIGGKLFYFPPTRFSTPTKVPTFQTGLKGSIDILGGVKK